MNLKQLLEAFETRQKELNALLAKGDDITSDEGKRITTLDTELDDLEVQIKDMRGAQAIAAKTKGREAFLKAPIMGGPAADADPQIVEVGSFKHIQIPAAAKRCRVTSFESDELGTGHQKAYAFGKWVAATLFGHEPSKEWCKDHGFSMEKAASEGVNTTGGYLVAPEFEADLIKLRERYGVFRQNAKNTTMRSDRKTKPRRTSGVTAYFVGEGATITDSQAGYDQVGLTARKLAALCYYSNELDEDSLIEIGDEFADEIAYAFAKKEDECGFIGDSTSTYGGITGCTAKLKAVDGTIANIKGLVVATGNLFSEFVLADFNGVVAIAPEYVDPERAAWYCSKFFYHNVMEKLMLAAGGVTAAEIAAGRRIPMFMSYPVRITQAMPKTDANSQVACLFGDLNLGALYGDRRQTTVALSTDVKFAEDQIAIRGTERFDINVHGVGDTTDAGPIVGLISAAA